MLAYCFEKPLYSNLSQYYLEGTVFDFLSLRILALPYNNHKIKTVDCQLVAPE